MVVKTLIRTVEAFGTKVRFKHAVGSYMAELAVNIFIHLRQHEVEEMFIADLLKDLGEGPDEAFPTGTTRLTKQQRLYRTLTTPVELDGAWLMSIERGTQTRMYEKVRKVVIVRDCFPDGETVTPRLPHVNSFRPDTPRVKPSFEIVDKVPPSPDLDLQKRIVELEQLVARLNAQLNTEVFDFQHPHRPRSMLESKAAKRFYDNELKINRTMRKVDMIFEKLKIQPLPEEMGQPESDDLHDLL
jgi:hypothetical protein